MTENKKPEPDDHNNHDGLQQDNFIMTTDEEDKVIIRLYWYLHPSTRTPTSRTQDLFCYQNIYQVIKTNASGVAELRLQCGLVIEPRPYNNRIQYDLLIFQCFCNIFNACAIIQISIHEFREPDFFPCSVILHLLHLRFAKPDCAGKTQP